MVREALHMKEAALWGVASFFIAFGGSIIPFVVVLVTDDSDKVLKSSGWLALNAFIVGVISDVCLSRIYRILFKTPWNDAVWNTLWVLGSFAMLTLLESLAHYWLKAYAHHGQHVHHNHFEIGSMEEPPKQKLRSISEVKKTGEDCDRMTACSIINSALHRQCSETNVALRDTTPSEAFTRQRSASESSIIQAERCHPHIYNIEDQTLCKSANVILLTRPLCESTAGLSEEYENENENQSPERAMSIRPYLQDHNHSDILHKYMDYLSAAIFYIAFSVHSVIEGCGLATSLASSASAGGGAQASRALGIGIVAHKGLAAIAVGGSILKLQARNFGTAALMIFFSCATPIGILIGLFHDRDKGFTLVMNQITTGSILFVLIHELIPQLASGVEYIRRKNGNVSYTISTLVALSTMMGAGAMYCATH